MHVHVYILFKHTHTYTIVYRESLITDGTYMIGLKDEKVGRYTGVCDVNAIANFPIDLKVFTNPHFQANLVKCFHTVNRPVLKHACNTLQ